MLAASPTTLKGDAGLEGFVKSVVSTLHDPIDPEFARSFLADTSCDDLAPELLDQLVGELLQVPARVWQEMFAGFLAYDDLAELGRINAPTLLMWGDTDGLVGRDMQDTLTEGVRDAELRVYEGVGHTPRWEDPRPFSGDVAAFVRRETMGRRLEPARAPRNPGAARAAVSGAYTPSRTTKSRRLGIHGRSVRRGCRWLG